MILEVKHLKKSFKEDFWKKPSVVLDNLSFSIPREMICGFLGANGAGKTTTIKSILGFIKPDRGEIFFGDSLGKSRHEAKKRIGFFPERPYFYPSLTGREFCHYMASLSEVSKKEAKEQLRLWSKKVNIDHALDKRIHHYSKGMLQRLGLVSCLVHQPKLVILDEPLSGLDPLGRAEFKTILKEIQKDMGATVFFSSHILSDVEEVCQNVIVLDKGKLTYQGEITSLIKSHDSNKTELIVSSSSPLGHPFIHLEEGIYKYTGENTEVQKLVREIPKDVEIISLSRQRPSLENILYNSRKENESA